MLQWRYTARQLRLGKCAGASCDQDQDRSVDSCTPSDRCIHVALQACTAIVCRNCSLRATVLAALLAYLQRVLVLRSAAYAHDAVSKRDVPGSDAHANENVNGSKHAVHRCEAVTNADHIIVAQCLCKLLCCPGIKLDSPLCGCLRFALVRMVRHTSFSVHNNPNRHW
jgi:hypothetical protein